jgi:hypothetical protein
VILGAEVVEGLGGNRPEMPEVCEHIGGDFAAPFPGKPELLGSSQPLLDPAKCTNSIPMYQLMITGKM